MVSARAWKQWEDVKSWQRAVPKGVNASPLELCGGSPMALDRLDAEDVRRSPRKLKRRADFLRVASKGNKVATKGLVLQALVNPCDAELRLGFTVTKKIGNAVTRNRTRRRLREAARIYFRDTEAKSADLVFVGRSGTAERRFDLLMGDIGQALRKLGVE